ncbi:MAG: polysaccharide biosynthesis tyrosine autokinase [Clostridia bacterium]|nr:polysaccharide biosynthesis tyrosine autokinase [Clostridia bacterium]
MKFSLKDIDIRSIVSDVFRNIVYIILAASTAVLAVAGFHNFTYKPQYTSTATLAVTVKGNNGGSYSSLYLTNEMADVFSEVFQSDALKKKIAEDLSVSSINGDISISIVPETNIMVLKVTADSPKSAYTIINSSLENYGTVSDYLFSNANINLIKEPTVPFSPSNNVSIKKNCLIAAMAAGGLVMLITALLSFLRPTVKNPSQAKNQLDGRLLGVIPFVKKFSLKERIKNKITRENIRKMSVLISQPMLGMPFAESYKKAATIIERHMESKNEKVLLVASLFENEGKSSVSANLAMALAQKGRRVLLIDADLRKPAIHKIFENKDKGYSFSDCIKKRCGIVEALHIEQDNLFCLYQYESLGNSSVLLSSEITEKIIAACRRNFDYVIIDSSPMGLVADSQILMQYSDAAVLTVREDWAQASKINDAIDSIKKESRDFVGVILNASKSVNTISGKSYGYGYGYGYGYRHYYDKYAKQS